MQADNCGELQRKRVTKMSGGYCQVEERKRGSLPMNLSPMQILNAFLTYIDNSNLRFKVHDRKKVE